MPRISLKVNRRFEGTRSLYLQGRRISHAKNLHEAGYRQTLHISVTNSTEQGIFDKVTVI
jgi:hypothetical protein